MILRVTPAPSPAPQTAVSRRGEARHPGAVPRDAPAPGLRCRFRTGAVSRASPSLAGGARITAPHGRPGQHDMPICNRALPLGITLTGSFKEQDCSLNRRVRRRPPAPLPPRGREHAHDPPGPGSLTIRFRGRGAVTHADRNNQGAACVFPSPGYRPGTVNSFASTAVAAVVEPMRTFLTG
jgi:hypothetical protein